MKLDVEPVPPPAKTRVWSFDIRRATLRTRVSECAQLVQLDLPDEELEATCDTILSNIKNSPNLIGDTYETSGCQHAECTILLHHLQNPETNPYNYFGVSKLSCLACYLFFTLYRQNVEIRNRTRQTPRFPPYFARGTHKKLYPGWSMPDLDVLTKLGFEEISTAMTQSLKREVADHIEQASSRAQSDSTASSEVSVPGTMGSLQDLDSRRRRLIYLFTSVQVTNALLTKLG
jgi:hypothetical protein